MTLPFKAIPNVLFIVFVLVQDEEAPDIDFIYCDEDDFSSETAELYSYTEGPEFALAHKAFEDATIKFNLPTAWG